ncbi:endonuclease domain-containing protein [Micromonospora sp. NPDC005806]|uniref:endonuclease domain-containing protein n=1 Tax=Micromonospora sp. NPDC005806 TaxID=3364234 RepID=UPI0036A4AEF1
MARGVLSRAELRSRAWRPLFKDVYADAGLTISHSVRCAAATRWVLPTEAAIAGRSAAALFGAGTVRPDEPVEVLLPVGQRFGPVTGLVVHTAEVAERDMLLRAGVRVTSPRRTSWDLAQWLPPEEAVAAVDGLLRQRLVTADELRDLARLRTGARGWKRMFRVADLADGGAESPQESRLRVRLVLAGLPTPVTQFVIERDGRFIARVDLAWPQWKIAIEYDGLWHHDTDQFHRDRQRLNRLLGEDWIVLHLTARRFKEDFPAFLDEVRHAIRTRHR